MTPTELAVVDRIYDIANCLKEDMPMSTDLIECANDILLYCNQLTYGVHEPIEEPKDAKR